MNNRKSRIGIFGGTFAPFTVAHREICKQFIDGCKLDELYIIPSIVSYHRKDKGWTGFSPIDMIWVIEKMVYETLPYDYSRRIHIDLSEYNLRTLCYELGEGAFDKIVNGRRFIHTLLDFRNRHGMLDDDDMPIVALGADEAEALPNWFLGEEIPKLCHLAISQGRDDTIADRPLTPVSWEFYMPQKFRYVSASKVREAISKRQTNLAHYLMDVKKYDEGKATLEELGWA